MEIIEMTNMCMIENVKTAEVLVLRRTKGNWTGIAFPGGHIEPGEGIIASVVREIKEETALNIWDLRLVGIKHWYFEEENKRYMVFLFKTENFSGDLVNSGDEGDVFWVKKDVLLSLDLARGFGETFKLMENSSLSEERHYANDEKNEWLSEFL